MSIFSALFKSVARKAYFPPPQAAAAPVPAGAWSLVVDADCNPVNTRAPQAGDMLARRPMSYLYGGTLPVFENNPAASMDKNIQDMLEFETRAERNKDFLENAVLLLSQTDDGRRLLDQAYTNKFQFVFDHGRVMEIGAVGLCDYKNKLIPLAEGQTAAEVALTLKHELQHMEDISKGLSYDLEDTPASARMANRALEGNARVSESIAAAEALLGSPQGPPQQFRTATLMNALWKDSHEMAKAACNTLELAAKGDWAGFAGSILPAYYQDRGALDYYDKRYADYLKTAAPDITADEQRVKSGSWQERDNAQKRIDYARHTAARLFTKDRWTSPKIAGIVTIRGSLKYISGIRGFDLGGAAALQTSPEMLPLFRALKDNLLKLMPGTEKAKLLELPVPEKLPVQAARGASPYAPYATPAETAPFTPIQMPNRKDGGMLTNGQRINAAIGERLAEELARMKSGTSAIDKLNYTLLMQISGGRLTSNLRGHFSALAEAGFRAPMGAFPEEYLEDLYKRIRLSQQAGSTGRNSAVGRQELKLIAHWQELKKQGLDPAWIDPDMKAKSAVAHFDHANFYIGHLERFLPGAPIEAYRPHHRHTPPRA